MLARLLWLVWNHDEGRLRALLRIVLHGALLALVLFGMGRLSPLWQARPFGPGLAFGLELFGVIAITWAAARFVDRRPFLDLGLRPRRGFAIDLLFGVVLGGVCMGLIALAEIVSGWASYAPRSVGWETFAPAAGNAIAVFASVAILEELVSRGYHLVNLAEGLARGPGPHRAAAVGALVISSCAFGLGHAGNPSATPISVAFIAFGGIFLAIGVLAQGDLAIPIGAHFGWNFFQNLFDMPVSGQTQYGDAALVDRVELGPDLATGGPFGPEGGLSGLAAMALGIVLTLAWVRARQGRIAFSARLGVPPVPVPVPRAAPAASAELSAPAQEPGAGT